MLEPDAPYLITVFGNRKPPKFGNHEQDADYTCLNSIDFLPIFASLDVMMQFPTIGFQKRVHRLPGNYVIRFLAGFCQFFVVFLVVQPPETFSSSC